MSYGNDPYRSDLRTNRKVGSVDLDKSGKMELTRTSMTENGFKKVVIQSKASKSNIYVNLCYKNNKN